MKEECSFRGEAWMKLGGRGCGLRGGVCGWAGAELVKIWKKPPGSLSIDSTWPDPRCPPRQTRHAPQKLAVPKAQAPGYEVAPWDKPQGGSEAPGWLYPPHLPSWAASAHLFCQEVFVNYSTSSHTSYTLWPVFCFSMPLSQSIIITFFFSSSGD